MRLIDADKLVDMLYDNEFASLCPLDEVSGVIDACPTVSNVEDVVEAEWIHWPITRCSRCNWSIESVWKSKRCPECGAHMENY